MGKRPLISNPFNLKEYLPEFTTYNHEVYLSYIYQLDSYLLIENKDSTVFFKPFEIKCNPNRFYTDYDKQAHYEDLVGKLKKILSPYAKALENEQYQKHEIKEKVEDLILDIIDSLAEHLSDLYDANHYTKLDTYENDKIKEYILNPVDYYNKYLNKDEPDKETVKEIVKDIEESIEGIISRYNANKHYFSNRVNKRLNNKFSYLVTETTKDPFLSLYLCNNPVGLYQAEAGESIVKEYGLKRYVLKDKSQIYFYDTGLKYFEEVTTQQLKNKIYKTFNFNLTEKDINAIIKAIPTEDLLHTNLLVFNNMYFDTETLREFKPLPEVNTYNRMDYLTVFNMGTLNKKNDKIKLLDYDKELKLDEILTINELPEINPKIPVNEYKKRFGMTLTEIVLRQVLVPKDNPHDIRLFKDYLERLGSNIYGANLYKAITFYYGDGDNGKSILNLFNNLIFNNLNYEITPDTLDDLFTLENFSNRLIITIDEVARNSFEELKAPLKQMSSKYSKMENRQMYSSKTFTLYGFPNITIYSNELLDLNPITDGALFSRLDYLKLPNRFVDDMENIKQYSNCYPIVNEVEELLSKDTEGLSWLITAGIICFKEMKENNNKYTLNQTREETIDIYLNIDYLSKFLLLYTEYIDDLPREAYTSNEDITNSYLKYMDNLHKKVNTDGLARDIGIKLKQTHPELKQKEAKYKQTNTGKTMYKVRLKEPEDITREFNIGYQINEYATDKQLEVLETNGKLQTVYRHIQKGNCTIAILEDELPEDKYNCFEIVQQLESLNLIFKTDQTFLKSK